MKVNYRYKINWELGKFEIDRGYARYECIASFESHVHSLDSFSSKVPFVFFTILTHCHPRIFFKYFSKVALR